MTRTMPIDEVCFRITDALRSGKLRGWERGFAASVTKNLKRPNWCPSPKQEWVMRRLVDEIRVPDGDLIDRGDGGENG